MKQFIHEVYVRRNNLLDINLWKLLQGDNFNSLLDSTVRWSSIEGGILYIRHVSLNT